MTGSDTRDNTAVADPSAQDASSKPAASKGAKKGSAKKKATKKTAATKPATKARKRAQSGTTANKTAPTTRKPTRPAATAPAAPVRDVDTARPITKGAKILAMLDRGADGVTLVELMEVTGWQAHSVRGFISTAGKKHSVNIESSKNEAGLRVYRIVK